KGAPELHLDPDRTLEQELQRFVKRRVRRCAIEVCPADRLPQEQSRVERSMQLSVNRHRGGIEALRQLRRCPCPIGSEEHEGQEAELHLGTENGQCCGWTHSVKDTTY